MNAQNRKWLERARISHYGDDVRLEKLSLDHARDLEKCGQDPQIWTHLGGTPFGPSGSASGWIQTAINADNAGSSASFAQIDPHTNRAVGSTRFMNPDVASGRVEIGFTWIAASHQRTALNTSAKLLMLDCAFTKIKAQIVELKTDLRNLVSQSAITRLGATRTKLIFRHQLHPGFIRDSVYFEIAARDWPKLRPKLLSKLR